MTSDQRLRAAFREHNERPGPTYVYRLGDRGFYAEVTTFARAAGFCAAHDLRLALDSRRFAYSARRGWADWFVPLFSDMVDGPVPVDRECDSMVRGPGTGMATLLDHKPDHLEVCGVRLGGGFEAVLGALTRMVMELSEPTAAAVAVARRSFEPPHPYAAVHARRGDKVGDEDVHYPIDVYLEPLRSTRAADAPLFVMSDDHQAVREARAAHGGPVHSLSEAHHRGFDIHALRRGEVPCEADDMETEVHRLLAETAIAADAAWFVGTFRSNVSRVVSYLRRGEATLLRAEDLIVSSEGRNNW